MDKTIYIKKSVIYSVGNIWQNEVSTILNTTLCKQSFNIQKIFMYFTYYKKKKIALT